MSKEEQNWKPSLMSMKDIEYDLRIGQTKFYEWMALGWMPQPWVKEGGVTRWMTSQIHECLMRFPDRELLSAEINRQSANLRGKAKTEVDWADQRSKRCLGKYPSESLKNARYEKAKNAGSPAQKATGKAEDQAAAKCAITYGAANTSRMASLHVWRNAFAIASLLAVQALYAA
jgi:predicted DNA-binding transcriptional regulator AlpA